MRADRLVAALLLLQSRGRMTAAALAAELEVSVATARRDLEALGAAGIPVYPQPGRGGGWQLLGGARTDLTGLTADEARALFLLVGPSAGASPQAASALRKLIRALPATFRADAEAAAAAVVVDPAAWGDRPIDASARHLLGTLQTAVVERRVVRLDYADRRSRRSTRAVQPWGLADKDGVWYLVAGTDRGRRTFRLDRIRDVEPTGGHFERPTDLELSAAWEEVVDEVERRRARTVATVVIASKLATFLEQQFGRHARRLTELDDGRVRVELAAPTAPMLAEQLAGWGALLDVEGPDEVRAELARIGAELTDRYACRPVDDASVGPPVENASASFRS